MSPESLQSLCRHARSSKKRRPNTITPGPSMLFAGLADGTRQSFLTSVRVVPPACVAADPARGVSFWVRRPQGQSYYRVQLRCALKKRQKKNKPHGKDARDMRMCCWPGRSKRIIPACWRACWWSLVWRSNGVEQHCFPDHQPCLELPNHRLPCSLCRLEK